MQILPLAGRPKDREGDISEHLLRIQRSAFVFQHLLYTGRRATPSSAIFPPFRPYVRASVHSHKIFCDFTTPVRFHRSRLQPDQKLSNGRSIGRSESILANRKRLYSQRHEGTTYDVRNCDIQLLPVGLTISLLFLLPSCPPFFLLLRSGICI